MKDLSSYMETVLLSSIPNVTINVHLQEGVYHINLDAPEGLLSRTDPNMLKTILTEYMDSELQLYFRKEIPKHNKNIKIKDQ